MKSSQSSPGLMGLTEAVPHLVSVTMITISINQVTRCLIIMTNDIEMYWVLV